MGCYLRPETTKAPVVTGAFVYVAVFIISA
jgi:hypothetical protein